MLKYFEKFSLVSFNGLCDSGAWVPHNGINGGGQRVSFVRDSHLVCSFLR